MKRTLSCLVTLTVLEGTLSSARADVPNSVPVSVQMSPAVEGRHTKEQQLLLSGFWAFATLNYLYCDIIGMMDSKLLAQYASGTVNGIRMSEEFLLMSTLLMQIPMSMILLSNVLGPRPARIANIAAGALMTVVQGATLAVGKPTSYYLASSIVEMASTTFITVYALFFVKTPAVIPTAQVSKDSMNVGLRFTF